jgi:hypothetical protein
MIEPSKLTYLEEFKFMCEASKYKKETILEFIRYLETHMKLKFYKDGGILAPVENYATDYDIDDIIFVIENINKPWLMPKIYDSAYFQKIFDDYDKRDLDSRYVIYRLKQDFKNIVNNQFYSSEFIKYYCGWMNKNNTEVIEWHKKQFQ